MGNCANEQRSVANGELQMGSPQEHAAVSARDNVEDQALWNQWKQAGSGRAGGILCDRYFTAVLAFFSHKVRSDRDAEDLTQQTFVELVRSKATPELVRAYIFGVARYVLIHHIGKKKRAPVDPSIDAMAEADPGPGLTTCVAASKDRSRLVTALRRLPIDDQILLALYYWEEMSGSELGEVLGVPEPTVRGRIAAAKRRLKDVLLAVTGSDISQSMRGLGSWLVAVKAQIPAPQGL
jgi:RNA polymerase sigma factor (sigma-70 family)